MVNRNEGDHQHADEEHREVGRHGPRRAIGVRAHHRAGDVETDAQRREKGADAHRDQQHDPVVERIDSRLRR
jgi:hypothetical protein